MRARYRSTDFPRQIGAQATTAATTSQPTRTPFTQLGCQHRGYSGYDVEFARETLEPREKRYWPRRRKTGGPVLVPEENGAFVLLTWPWLRLGPHANARSGLQC